MNIHLHIERVVVDSVPRGAGQRDLLQAAIQTELARLLADGLAPGLVAGTALAHSAGAPLPGATGAGIAASIYGAIGKPP